MAIYSEEEDQNVLDYNKSMKKTITHRVVLEIEVEAENPLEAAKEAQKWLQDKDSDWQFYVQPCDKSEDVFSVDLAEEDEDAVLEVDNYIPMIK
jgi:hypothetical protein